jgi:hypothetical protein
MITESKFYGSSKDVSLTGDYEIDFRVARLWSFTPTASGHKVELPNPTGMKLGGIYFLVVNHSDTHTFTIVDNEDETVTVVGTEEACILSLSEIEFTVSPTMLPATVSGGTYLIGKWGLLGFPPIYTSASGGLPTVHAYWNWKLMTLGDPEGYEAIRYFLFGGIGDLNGCDQFDGVSTWVTKSDMPDDHSGSWNFAMTVHNIYVGIDSSSLYKFKPTEDVWINEGSLVEAHGSGAAFAVKEKGYVVGGVATKYMESFYGRTWTRKNDHSYYTSGCIAFADSDKGYLTNGKNDETGGFENQHFRYDPVTDTWDQRDDMPDPERFNAASFYIHEAGKYYVVGGQNDTPNYFDDMEEWDPVTDTWTGKADITVGNRSQAAGASADFGSGTGQKGLHFCGYNGTAHDDVYLYTVNTPSNTWVTLGTTPGSVTKQSPSAAYAGA